MTMDSDKDAEGQSASEGERPSPPAGPWGSREDGKPATGKPRAKRPIRASDENPATAPTDDTAPSDDRGGDGADARAQHPDRPDRPDRGTEPRRNPWELPPPARRAKPGRPQQGMGGLLTSMRQFGGGNGAPPARAIGLAIGAVVLIWLALTCFHRIEPQEAGVVMRLGRYSHTLQPGVSLTLPAPIDQVHVIDVRNIRTIPIPAGNDPRLVLTGDQNIIDLDYSVRWDIADPVQYRFQLASPAQTITAVSESAMREAMANVSLNDAMGSGRGAIEVEVANRIQQVLNHYRAGIRIQGVAIQRADPPAAVNDAFKQVTAAQQEAQTAINRANAHAQQVIAGAEGAAGEFDRVYAQYRLAPDVTRRRLYYETMEAVLGRVNKTIVEAPGVMSYLPLRPLQGAPARETNQTVVQGRPGVAPPTNTGNQP